MIHPTSGRSFDIVDELIAAYNAGSFPGFKAVGVFGSDVLAGP